MQSCIKAIPEILERTLRVAGAKYLSTGSALLKVINNTTHRVVLDDNFSM